MSHLQTLRTWLDVNAAGLNDEQAAAALNADAPGPNNVCWRTSVDVGLIGNAVSGAELAVMSSLNLARLQTVLLLSQSGFNPSLPGRRRLLEDIFSGVEGAVTRAALLAAWKRTMTVGERLFATGTGSDASPATLGSVSVGERTVYLEGPVSFREISEARNL